MPHPRLTPDALIIKQEDPTQPDVVELMRHGEAFSAGLYPPESRHHLALDVLRGPEVRFLVARDGQGKALQLALLFSTTAGRKLSECGLKTPREAKE
jgi:putative acetyltransferase